MFTAYHVVLAPVGFLVFGTTILPSLLNIAPFLPDRINSLLIWAVVIPLFLGPAMFAPLRIRNS